MRRFSKRDRLNPHNLSIIDDDDIQEDIVDETNTEAEDSSESSNIEVQYAEQ